MCNGGGGGGERNCDANVCLGRVSVLVLADYIMHFKIENTDYLRCSRLNDDVVCGRDTM